MSDHYIRVYSSVIDDPKFADVYPNEAAMGTWLKLLLTADAVWPASCDLPRWVRPGPLRLLVDAKIVDLLPAHRFRIHGLDAERTRRAASAAVGGRASGRSRGAEQSLNDRSTTVPRSFPEQRNEIEPSQAKPSQAKTENEPISPRADTTDPADAYWQLTGKYPSDKALFWIDEMAARFGSEATVRAIATAHIQDRNGKDLLSRAQDRLRAEARELDRREREDEQRRLAEKRARPPNLEEWQIEFRRLVEERYGDAA